MTVDAADAKPVDSDGSGKRPMWAYGLLLFAGGVVFGLFGAFISAIVISVGGVDVPVGLVLSFATLFSLLRMVIHLFGVRRAGVILLIGWLAATVLLALPGPGGDVAIASDPIALIYLFGGVIIGTACVNVPARLRVKSEQAAVGEEADSGSDGAAT